MKKKININDVQSCDIYWPNLVCSLETSSESKFICTLNISGTCPSWYVTFYDGTILDYSMKLFGERCILNELDGDEIGEYKEAAEKYLDKYYPTEKEEQEECDNYEKERIINTLFDFCVDKFVYKCKRKYIISSVKNDALGELISIAGTYLPDELESDTNKMASYLFYRDDCNDIDWGNVTCENVEYFELELNLEYPMEANISICNNKVIGNVIIDNSVNPELVIDINTYNEYRYDIITKTFLETSILETSKDKKVTDTKLLSILQCAVNSANLEKLFRYNLHDICDTTLKNFIRHKHIYFECPRDKEGKPIAVDGSKYKDKKNFYISSYKLTNKQVEFEGLGYIDYGFTVEDFNKVCKSVFNFTEEGFLKGKVFPKFYKPEAPSTDLCNVYWAKKV